MRLAASLALIGSLSASPIGVASAAVELCHGVVATIVGTSADDLIEGTPASDVVVGKGGRDVIRGRGGNDLICGGAGRDDIHGGQGKDVLYGGPGADTVHGNHGHDRLYGGGQDDSLFGGGGNDRIFGRGGVDFAGGSRWSDVCRAEDESRCELDYRGPRPVELWEALVDEYFGDIGQTANALTIVDCESNGDPFAYNPDGHGPKGLFQFIPDTWDWASDGAGWAGETPYHPVAATASARFLYEWSEDRGGGGWDPWTNCRCKIVEYDCKYKSARAD